MPNAIEIDPSTAIAGDHHGGRSSRTRGDGRRAWGQGGSRVRRLALAACLVAIGAGAATLVAHGSGTRVTPAKMVPLGTATVHRGDLIETQRYRGRLSYPPRGSAHLSGPGTVTSLPHAGQMLTEGASIASVDDRPVGVLFGTTPLYRPLGTANTTSAQLAVRLARADLLAAQAALLQTQSPDAERGGLGGGGGSSESEAAGVAVSSARAARVAQTQVSVDEARERLLGAERALSQVRAPQRGPDVALVAGDMAALGYYRGFTDSWNAALQDAVRLWQDHIGAPPSGDIDPDDVLVVSGAARVTGVQGGLGDAPSAVTISLSSPSRLATFRLRNGVPGRLARGRRVRLSAAGAAGAGRVVSVKTNDGSAVVQVAFDQSSALARVASTVVSMSVRTASRRDVLTVPTQALLALASGGYALQLPDGRLLGVRTGVVQGGDIEVSGRSVYGGLRVVSVT
jgi:hypothetical protein